MPLHAANIALAEWSITILPHRADRLQLDRFAVGVFPARDRSAPG